MLKTKAVVKKPAVAKAKAKPIPKLVAAKKPATVVKAKAKPIPKLVADKKLAAKKPATVKAKSRTKAVAKAKSSAIDVKKPATVKAKPRTKAVVKPKPRKRYKGGDIQEKNIIDLLTAFFDFYNIYTNIGYLYPKNNESDFKYRIQNIGTLINDFNTNLNGENTDGFKDFVIDTTLQNDIKTIYDTSYNIENEENYKNAILQVVNLLHKLDNTIIPIIEIIEIENNKFKKIYDDLLNIYKDTDAYDDFLKK